MSIADKQKWNAKYAQQRSLLPSPPDALIANLKNLRAGNVLDIACGEGAVSLFLSKENKFNVTAIDVSQNGLNNLQNLAGQQQCKIITICQDLDDLQALSALGQFDSITVFRYKPSPKLLLVISRMLKPNGRLIISTFNQRHHLATGFASKFCLTDNEFLDLDLPVTLVSYLQSDNPPFTDSYVFENR